MRCCVAGGGVDGVASARMVVHMRRGVAPLTWEEGMRAWWMLVCILYIFWCAQFIDICNGVAAGMAVFWWETRAMFGWRTSVLI